MKDYRDRLIVLSLVLSSSIGCDQTTKRIAEQTLSDTSYSFLFDTIRLQFIKNSGAFLGFGSEFSESAKFWLFLVMPTLFLLVASLFLLLAPHLNLVERVLIALMISGGIGNLIDRILLSGHVTDFINVGIGPLRTGVFNIADVAIMAGAIGWLLLSVKKPKPISS